jgi:NADH-quinone oxidoreductase subunit N
LSLLITILVLVAAGATILLSLREPASVDRRGEYVGLVLLSTAGMILTAQASDLIVIFLGIELLSVALYVLCALEVWRNRSLEAGLKYLITGAVGASVLLYGLAFLYGATGSTALATIGEKLSDSSLTSDPLVTAAMVLIVAGLAFKASAAPFHMWAPDVYEGAPTPITAFMATATKVAAFAAFLRIFVGTLPDGRDDWRVIIAVVAAASILIGNIAALRQKSVKRILAYSGVAQAGYLLIGVAAGSFSGTRATMYYLVAYVAMTLGVFAVAIHREREVEHGDDVESFRGYGRARPAMGISATICLLSLAGFPPLSGFIGKFLLFGAAVDHDLTWLAIVGAVGSVISLGYYLRLIAVMWMDEPKDTETRRLSVPGAVSFVAVASAVAVVGLALAAAGVLDASGGAAETLLSP